MNATEARNHIVTTTNDRRIGVHTPTRTEWEAGIVQWSAGVEDSDGSTGTATFDEHDGAVSIAWD